MKILQVHSKYKKLGGEESVIEEERTILEENGHEVVQYIRDNAETDDYSALELAKLSFSQRKNKKAIRDIKALIAKEKPNICHVHNVYPLISPAVYEIFQEHGIPVVQTLHNYKMLCTNSLLFREGEVCELCLNKSLLNSIKYACYKDSFLATAAQADAIQFHRRKGTWQNDVDAYVCLTDFQKDKMVQGGMPIDKIQIKANFVQKQERSTSYEDFFLFVGRLENSKGLADLLSAMKECTEIQFVLIGNADDPEIFSEFANVNYLGTQGRENVLNYISQCKAVVFPSKYYEGMPMVILEAFSMKKAVVAREVGAMSSMIRNQENGLSYSSVDRLIEGIRRLNKEEGLAERLGSCAYIDYQNMYSVKQGYENLINLYNSVLERKHGV